MIIERPDLELVGVHANGAGKVGRDAADLCGLTSPTGVIATDDIDALVALGADCVVYTSQAETRPKDAIEEISGFLARAPMSSARRWSGWSPPTMPTPGCAIRCDAACTTGGTSLYINGIDPGFSGDTPGLHRAEPVPAARPRSPCRRSSTTAATTTPNSPASVSVSAPRPDHTADHVPARRAALDVGRPRSAAWPTVSASNSTRCASATRSWVTPEPIDCTMMRVEPGPGGRRPLRASRASGRQPVITMEHVNRLTPAAAPHWPYPPDGRPGVHRVVVDGQPRGRDQRPRRLSAASTTTRAA